METNHVLMNPSITVRTADLMAALSCASKEETRYYLGGIFVHLVDGYVRMVTTDGHRLLCIQSLLEGVEPDWLGAGLIIPRDGLAERLKLIKSLKEDGLTAKIAYQTGDGHLTVSDPKGYCQFRMRPVDGTFPEYQKIIDRLNVFEGRELSEMASISFNPGYLKGIGEVATALGAGKGSVQLRAQPGHISSSDEEASSSPTLVTFAEAPNAMMLLMPMRGIGPGLSGSVARMLEGPVKGTIAALRAHKTRTEEKLESAHLTKAEREELEAKVADYDRRIATVLAGAGATALPAPTLHRYQTDLAAELGDLAEKLDGDQVRRWFERGTPVTEAAASVRNAIEAEKAEMEYLETARTITTEALGFTVADHVILRQRQADLSAEAAAQAIITETLINETNANPDLDFLEWLEGVSGTLAELLEVDPARVAIDDDVSLTEWFDAGKPYSIAAREIAAEKAEGIPRQYSLADALDEPAPPAASGAATLSAEAIAEQRAKLKGKGRKTAMRKFIADLNAALSETAGLTVGQLSEGVPVDDWFTSGLTPVQAAERALAWKKPEEPVDEGKPETEAPVLDDETIDETEHHEERELEAAE